MANTTTPPGESADGSASVVNSDESSAMQQDNPVREYIPITSDQIIVDGLLCSIVKAISRSPIEQELIASVDRCTSDIEIKTAGNNSGLGGRSSDKKDGKCFFEDGKMECSCATGLEFKNGQCQARVHLSKNTFEKF